MINLLMIAYCMCAYGSNIVSTDKLITLHGDGVAVVCTDKRFTLMESDDGYSISNKNLKELYSKCAKEQIDLCQ
jgi:hypothetical protein